MSEPLHILVADDLADNRGLLTQLLKLDGHRVSEAADGVEALALIAQGDVDVLLLDLQMPMLDGFGVLTHLSQADGPFVPVLVVTAAAERELRLRALDLGAQDFLTKPVDSQELRTRVRTLGALKRAQDRLRAQAAALQEANAELLRHNERIENEVDRRTEDLRAANERLQAADRHKDEFLSVISHELRTPLNFIMGFASILADEVAGPMAPMQADYVGKILRGTDRMLMLVNDLLDFAHMRFGDFRLSPVPTAYEMVVAEAIATMQPLADRKGIALTAEVALEGPVTVDPQRLLQVLANLLDNGIKFTPHGGFVRVSARIVDGMLETSVRDTGCGIERDDIPRLFERFRQLDMGNTREAGGVGLGLAICKAIVEAHGGAIGVESAPGHGAAFYFRLPLSQPVAPARDPAGCEAS
jgi:signal transduction histidine kinase